MFYIAFKKHRQENRIHMLMKEDGTMLNTEKEINDHIVQYYRGLLGTTRGTELAIDKVCLQQGPMVNEEANRILSTHVT